jgi:prealbumin domain-containing protein
MEYSLRRVVALGFFPFVLLCLLTISIPAWSQQTGDPTTLTVKVKVENTDENGGTAKADDFVLKVRDIVGKANNGSLIFGKINVGGVTDGETINLPPGTYFVTKERGPSYLGHFSDCNNVTLAAGDEKTCTVTFSDEPAQLFVKVTVGKNNNPKNIKPSDFNISPDANGPNPVFFAGENQGRTTVKLKPGDYKIEKDEVVTNLPVLRLGFTVSGCSGTAKTGVGKNCDVTIELTGR